MVGAAYAAVPFYDWFCRVTGFNGTTQVATQMPSGMLERSIAVRFDANVMGGLPWKFEPEKTEINVRIGEVVTAYYTVTNLAARPTLGPGGLQRDAAHRRHPLPEDQLLLLHRAALCARREARDGGGFLRRSGAGRRQRARTALTITLSYTFYPMREEPKPVAAQAADKRNGTCNMHCNDAA